MFTKIGSLCPKHPDLNGLRMKNRACVECSRLKANLWKKVNKIHTERLSGAARRAMRNQRMPSWADRSKIASIYREAKSRSLQVDHIIPLNHPLVCGLHVETNMQLLSKWENNSKGNRFNPLDFE